MTDRTIVYRIQADTAAFEANMRHAGATVRKAAGDMTAEGDKFRRGLTTLGDTAGKVGLVAAAGLGATVKAAIDWESAWAGVEKTVDGTATQMAGLEGELRELAKTMPATHQEIAATAEAAGQLGVARDDVAAFTKTMLMLGETTNLTSDDAATSIAQFMNVMKTSAADVDQIGNTLVDLGNKGASTEAQILDMTQRLSGAGALVGATEADVLALASSMANLGIQSQLGGGAIQRVFTNIYQAAANGAEGLQGFADVAGVSADQFADDWANDPVRAFDAFLQGLGRIKDSGGNVVGTLDELGIKGTQNLQVMLRLAGAGDMLTTTLDQSASAWEKNSALTDEYRKRAETTASQMQVAWNQIKDAGIEAGEGLLPVVAEVAGKVGGLATAFGNLPGPVKATATGFAGVTAVLGGGLWFTAKAVNGVANMRSALADLNVTADGTKSKLGGLATAATVATGLYALSGAVVALANSLDESLPGLETLEGRLISLASTPKGFSVSLGQEFDSLGGSIDRLSDPSKWQRLNEMAGSFNDAILPGDARDKGVREATAEIEALDAALAGLASEGHADVAADALERLVESYGFTAEQTDWLLSQLPKYDEALAGIANQATLTGGATDGLAGDTQGLGGAFDAAATEAEDFGDKLDRLNEKLSGRADMRSYEAAIDDFTKSIQENGRTFDITTDKGRTNQAMLDGIASSALSVAEGLGTAARKKFLTNAIQDLRTMGENMNLPKSEINKLIALLREANKTDVKPKIDVDTGASMSKIAAVRNSIEALRDRRLTITTVYDAVRNSSDALPYRGKADGGLLRGPGTGTSDDIPIWASNGEYVMKAAAVEKYGVHMFDRLNAMHFATGGSVKKGDKPKPPKLGIGRYVDDGTAALESAIDRLTDKLENQTQATEHATAEQEFWASKMSDLAQATVSGFNSGLFDKSSNPWAAGAGAGALFNLNKDIAGLNERAGLQSQLAGLGLTGDALAALLSEGSNADISALVASGQVEQYAALYNQRAALQGSVGTAAGQMAYGTPYAAASAERAAALAEQQQTNAELATLNARLQQMERALADAPERIGAATGAGVRGEAVKGHKDKKNGGRRR